MLVQKILSRDFVLTFFAQFAFSSVFCILIPTFPIYLSRLKSTDVEIGILVGVFSVSSLIFRPFVGRALLRIPERTFMIAGALIYTLASMAYLFASSFWPILIVRFFQGIGLAFFSTSSFTFVASITPERHRGQILSYFFVAINIAFTLAPFFGMILINHFNFIVLFLVCTGLSLCSLFIAAKLTGVQHTSMEARPDQGQPFLSREALQPSIMSFLINLIWGGLMAFFPLYALSKGVTNPGHFFGVLAAIHVFGRIFGGGILDLYEREKVILPCLIAYILSMALLTFSTTLSMFILVAVIWGAGNTFLYPSLVAYALDRAGASRGPAMGTFTAVSDLGSGIGPVITGTILQLTSYRIMFSALVLIGILNLLYFLFFVRKR